MFRSEPGVMRDFQRLLDECRVVIAGARRGIDESRQTVADGRRRSVAPPPADRAQLTPPVPGQAGRAPNPARPERPIRRRDAALVLVVADAETAAMYEVGLRIDGFDPLVATRTAEAMARVQHLRPDVLVADADARSADSFAVIRQLQFDGQRPVPVVLLVNDADRQTPTLGYDCRCAAMLMKPCLPNQLSSVIRQLL